MSALGPPLGAASEILDLLGRDAMCRLVAQYGGMRLYVPVRPSEEMIAAIGLSGAESLASRFAGERILIPIRPPALSSAEVRQLKRSGMTINEIGRAAMRSRRWVCYALREGRETTLHSELHAAGLQLARLLDTLSIEREIRALAPASEPFQFEDLSRPADGRSPAFPTTE